MSDHIASHAEAAAAVVAAHYKPPRAALPPVAAPAGPGEHCPQVARSEPDNREDLTGLDDGPYLPGRAPRKRSARKSPAVLAEIRARAWATRRARYGERGHA